MTERLFQEVGAGYEVHATVLAGAPEELTFAAGLTQPCKTVGRPIVRRPLYDALARRLLSYLEGLNAR
jgi:hypothetical protein